MTDEVDAMGKMLHVFTAAFHLISRLAATASPQGEAFAASLI
jgi:hypothetical protein